MDKAIKKVLKESAKRDEWQPPDRYAAPISQLLTAHENAHQDLDRLNAGAEPVISEAKLLNTIINQISDLVYAKDTDGYFLVGSDALARYYGLESAQELIGKTIFDVRGAAEAKRITAREQAIMAGGDSLINMEEELIDTNGVSKWIQISKVAMKDENGKIIGLIGMAGDITERKNNERILDAERQLFRALIDQVPDYLFVKDTESAFVVANRALAADLGLEPAELIGKTDFAFHREKIASKFYGDEQEIVHTGKALFDLEEMVIDYSGAEKWFSASKAPLLDDDNQIIGIVGVCRDITQHKKNAERIHFMAMHDALTHLPNRTLLVERLEQGIAQAEQSQGRLTVLFIDLDNFKNVNDSLGHNAGDILIKAVADRLTSSVRSSDTVARLGGDEFVILLADEDKLASDVGMIIERVRAAIAKPFIIEGQQFSVTCSIGGAAFPKDGTDSTTLLMNADIAMYQAKGSGRDSIVFYTQGMDDASREQRMLLEGLKSAIANDEISLVYQPQVELETGEIFAVEALARWHNFELGHVSPAKFIPLAEDSGLIVPIGDWVLQEACRQNKAWQDAGMKPITVCVNVSTRQIREPDWVQRVAEILRETGMDAQYLELEITESMLMSDVEQAINMMRALREIGVNFAIDDFGTGYSSLSALKSYPVTRLKLDRSFITDLENNNDEKHIAEAIISLGQKLDMRVIAEGVETDEQLDFLREAHCDEFQGFHFSKPVGPAVVAEMISNHVLLK
ncbi:putative bifunctional diguanylate cyclase/phosphodiesterase [Ahrensia marina]|uniref:putative bifunctional diguanylate cyclase/phosphodiesterase n=1 Tax=Ahrensia marina TaxID=1514904 RepID=UPI0006B4E2EC|nr:bifunctional diguanylate cyclase/phosphodiesterase [Ahrensia marina]